MTSGQRKAHKYIWLFIAIVIPLIMFFAVKDLDISTSQSSEKSFDLVSKEKVLNVYEDAIIKASVYKNHIEIILKSTLKNASSVVYETNTKGGKSNVIGQLTTAGIYKFNINNLPKGIIVFDDIKKVDITKFSFKWD